jgi:hypothetical protein
VNRNYYSHQKNKSHDYIPYTSRINQNNISYRDNRFNKNNNIKNNVRKNLSETNKERKNKEKYLDKIKNKNKNNYSLYNNNKYMSVNKSQDFLKSNKLSLNLSSYHKKNNGNMLLNKKSIIYIKPKSNKFSLKKEIIKKEKENDLNGSIDNNSNYPNSIHNKTFVNNSNNAFSNIFNMKKQFNDNIVYNIQNNNSFTLNNINKEHSPIKPKSNSKKHSRNISDLAKEIIDNANINMSQKEMKSKENEFNSNTDDDNNNNNEINNFDNRNINEIIGNEDLFEEIIIKDICTYDKKLWVFIKYIISPKAKQNFLKIKIKRLKLLKDSKNIILNKELNQLKLKHTDSIELISTMGAIAS